MKGRFVEIAGVFKTRFAVKKDGKRNSISKVYALNIKVSNQNEEVNAVYLEGCIVDIPCFCETPMSISFRLEIPRKNNPDYIRCQAYGKGAFNANKYAIGEKVKIYGKLVSRKYFQRVSSSLEEQEERISYEVIIDEIEEA